MHFPLFSIFGFGRKSSMVSVECQKPCSNAIGLREKFRWQKLNTSLNDRQSNKVYDAAVTGYTDRPFCNLNHCSDQRRPNDTVLVGL